MAKDFHPVEFGSRTPAPAPRHQPPEIPSDAVLVPMDQWNRLLGQLGNIHEAGQQLADARERMARAETENTFLKERIRDLREKLESTPEPEPEPEQPATEGPASVVPDPPTVRLEMKLPRWASRFRRHR